MMILLKQDNISFFILDYLINMLYLKNMALYNLYNILIYILHPRVEFYNAVFGTIAFIGNDIRVKFKSPLIIFLPINFIIYFPIDLIFVTCFLSPHILPPFECPNSCLGS